MEPVEQRIEVLEKAVVDVLGRMDTRLERLERLVESGSSNAGSYGACTRKMNAEPPEQKFGERLGRLEKLVGSVMGPDCQLVHEFEKEK
jgi:hypothetical protein